MRTNYISILLCLCNLVSQRTVHSRFSHSMDGQSPCNPVSQRTVYFLSLRGSLREQMTSHLVYCPCESLSSCRSRYAPTVTGSLLLSSGSEHVPHISSDRSSRHHLLPTDSPSLSPSIIPEGTVPRCCRRFSDRGQGFGTHSSSCHW